jgi:cardiolipin synthase A/B
MSQPTRNENSEPVSTARPSPNQALSSARGTRVETSWFSSLEPDYSVGNDLLLLSGGQEFFPELEAQIDLAKSEVFLETYIFEYDASGQRIAAALARAANRGVAVRLVVDGFGSKGLHKNFTDQFTSAAVQWQIFRPEKRYITLDRQRLRRLHRKLALIDGAVAFVGGINVLDDFYDPNHGVLKQPRFDFAVRIRGPVVASVHLAVSRMWWQLATLKLPNGLADLETNKVSLPESVSSVVDPVGPYKAKFIPRDNFRFRKAIEKSYLRAIGRARREILIANAYFLPGTKFRRALILAAQRGVRVRLLLQGIAEYKMQHWATQAIYDELLAAGIEIIEYKKSFLHAKVALADDWVTVGSSNIDPFSLLLAREANIVVLDQEFADQLRAKVEAGIHDGGQAILLHSRKKISLPMRVVHHAAFGLMRVAVAVSGIAGRY